MVLSGINSLVAEYTSDPIKKYPRKEAAIALFIALAIKTQSLRGEGA